jgi:3-dehydrosphinganine reductase
MSKLLNDIVTLSTTSTTTVIIGIVIVLIVITGISSLFSSSKVKKYNHVVITGGSSGIGYSLALALVRQGTKVTLLARNLAKLKEAQSILQEEYYKVYGSHDNVVMIASVDVSESEEVVIRALVPSIKAYGIVDLLINCAGTSIAGSFDTLPADEFERMLKINVLGSIYPTRAVLSGMKSTGKGNIVFVASQVAQVAIHGYTAYAASKWAIRGLAEALQMEVKPYGIYVSVAYPPDTDTPGYANEMETKPNLTKQLSESGNLFKPDTVAVDILSQISSRYFGITTGLDGWLLKQLHPGMSPINNISELLQQILFCSIARIISVFYIIGWDIECNKAKLSESSSSSATTSPSIKARVTRSKKTK